MFRWARMTWKPARPGLAGNKVSGVVLELNRTASVNFKLKVGNVSTVVEVVEASPLIDTSSAQLQNSFNSELSVNLPSAGNFLNDTGVLNLSLLAPGVTQSGGMGYGDGPSVGGQRPTNNSFNIDGVDNNRHDVTGPVSRFRMTLSPSSPFWKINSARNSAAHRAAFSILW